MSNLKRKAMLWAEIADAWRLVPRILVALYGILVFSLYSWYRTLETVDLIECDSSMIRTLVELGTTVERAYEMSCVVVGITGGPTTEQNIFITAIIGLATGIFAFYVNSGRKWDSGSAPHFDPYPRNPENVFVNGREVRRNNDTNPPPGSGG